MSSTSDSTLPPPHHHTHASPLRRMRPPTHAPTTPATPATAAIKQRREERALHQPSPNRTEAAAAMMHLFASSTSDKAEHALQGVRLPTHPPLPGVKVKRKYVRKAPRKPSSAAKKLIKISEDTKEDGEVDEVKHEKPSSAQTSELGSATGGDDDMGGSEQPSSPKENDGDSSFAPFREYNRKEKSLGLLCENFLKLYRSDQVTEICLDRAATELGVERRRIYDIVNILESIHLVSRKSKNLYNWHGLGALAVSTTAMRKKYAEMLMQEGAGASSYDYNFKDRRRGKSLSKLSQMFVQLFLKKDHCIIPLDQAAKQLIQMEDSENEEDRQLKTKIRRLYDVANVLVSVGLIEKMQLSNSRKPVFRWKYRGPATDAAQSNSSESYSFESRSQVPIRRNDNSANEEPQIKMEATYLSRNNSIDDSDVMKTSQSCDSDNASDSSDSQTEAGSKRKPSGRPTPSSDKETSNKRSRIAMESPMMMTPVLMGSDASTGDGQSLLRFNKNNAPVHPQIIYQEQQVQVRQFMERYIHEYINHIIVQQVRHDPLSLGGGPAAARSSAPTPSMAPSRGLTAKEVAASMTQDIHHTPMSIPSIMNRVSSELAGSIHDIVFSTNSTSPQSVADLLPIDTRNVTKSLQKIGLTTPPSHGESTAVGSSASLKKVAVASKLPIKAVSMASPESVSSASSSASPSSSSSDEEDNQLQARRLFKAFQPPSITTSSAAKTADETAP